MLEEKIEKSRDLTAHIKKYAQTKLKVRLIVYFIVAFIMVCLVAFDIANRNVPVTYSLTGIAIGIVVGTIVSRMFHISWDEKAQMVISRLDTVGIIILVLYLSFEIYREVLVERLFQDGSALAISFSVLAGIMIGRVLGIRRKINKVLKENL